MKKSIFTESDFLVASQDSLEQLIKSVDGEILKKNILNRLSEYQITHNQFGFIQDVCVDSLKHTVIKGEMK